MSLFKKMLPSTVTGKKSKESLASNSSSSSTNSATSRRTKGQSSCDGELSDIADVFLLDMKYKDKREGLNFYFAKQRRQGRKLSRLKQGLLDMDSEMRELQRIIARTEAEMKAVEGESKEKMEELETFLKKVDKENDSEVEVRKREPLVFKRYTNLKTASECQHLLKTVRQKRAALQYLEMLIYRKYIKFHHGGPRPDKGKGISKHHSLIPVKPIRLKDFRVSAGDEKEKQDGVVYVEIEDRQDECPDVIDLTGEDDFPPASPFNVPRESEV